MTEELPLNLYNIRHGDTEATDDPSLYARKADHAMRLTPEGIKTERRSAIFLADRLYQEFEADPENFGKVRVWFSPHYRGRESAWPFIYELGQRFGKDSGIVTYREQLFIFEQKAGLYDGLTKEEFTARYPDAAADYAKHEESNGRAYARSPLGDSRIDVTVRGKPFFGTVLRDKKEQDIRHAVCVNHGATSRAITMGWMHYPPEWMDAEQNPGTGWIRHLHGSRKNGYVDEGYIYGDNAPLHDPMVTQRQLPNAEQIFMLKPQRPGIIVPPGIKLIDPFEEPYVT